MLDLSHLGLCGKHLHPPQPQQLGGAPGRREGNEGRGAAKAPRNPPGGSDGRGERRSCIGSFANLVTQLLVQLAEIHQQRESGSGSGYGQAWWWRELRAHNCLKPAPTVPLSRPSVPGTAVRQHGGPRQVQLCWRGAAHRDSAARPPAVSVARFAMLPCSARARQFGGLLGVPCPGGMARHRSAPGEER